MGRRWIGAVAAVSIFFIGFGSQRVLAADGDSVETSLGGLSYYLDEYYKNQSDTADNSAAVLFALEEVKIPENIGIAKVNDRLNIRKGPGTDTPIVGYLPAKAACRIQGISDGWAKITSGDVSGYVSTEYLWYGAEGVQKAKEYGILTAKVNAGKVNLRSEPSTEDPSNILTGVYRGDVFKVLNETILTRDSEADLWVKVTYMETEGYLAKQFMDLAYQWDEAIQVKEPDPKKPMVQAAAGEDKSDKASVPKTYEDTTELRNTIISTAKKYLGLKYVYGGNSLTTGTDCSGFCLAVYRACGADTSGIPRSSASMAVSSAGRSLSRSELKPGDLLFYGNDNKTVNHVAIYMGNNKIIHQSAHSGCVIISDMNYRPYIKAKNFID